MAVVAYLQFFAALLSFSAAQVLHGVLDYCEGSDKEDYKAITRSGYALVAPQFSLGLVAAVSLLSCLQRGKINSRCKVIIYNRGNCQLFSVADIASYLVADAASTVVQLVKVPCYYHKRVNGGWSTWAATLCSVTCGEGNYTKTRTCTQPSPAYTGSPCQGIAEQDLSCNIQPCPIHGGWTTWNLGSCSTTCGGGIKTNTRTCTQPAPAHGGNSCLGSGIETFACNTLPCPIHGGWTAWKSISIVQCDGSCEDSPGSYTSGRRTCTQPAPGPGGSPCAGEDTQSRSCTSNKPCP